MNVSFPIDYFNIITLMQKMNSLKTKIGLSKHNIYNRLRRNKTHNRKHLF